MKTRLPILLSLLVITASASRSFAQDATVARVGNDEIKAAQISPYLAGLSEAERQALAKDPALLSRTIRALILQQILFKEALAAGWDKDPEVVAQLDRLRQGAIAETYLQSISKVPAGYPSDADVKAAYEAKKADLLIPKQLRLAQIYVAAPKDAEKADDDKARARIDAAAKAVKSSDFATVAKDQSDERESASRGGEVGWIAEASIQPEIRTKVAGLSKGGTTDPIRLNDGYYIVKVLDVRDAHTATLEEIKDQLVAALKNERARLNREAYLAKLQQQNPVALDEIGLTKVLQK